MTMAADDVESLADRPGWTVTGNRAVYAPSPDGWRAIVARIAGAARAFERFHIALVDPTGVARYTDRATTVEQAALIAERQVRGR